MKRFTWKIVICLVPLLISALVVGKAFTDYWNGRGGFKLGVDLVGGTILIYEVDPNRLPEGWDARQAQELARRLKSRIDPSDIYNMSIRALSDTRFEIIMPTGGRHQIEAEEKLWKALLQDVDKAKVVVDGKEVPLKIQKYLVPAGHKTHLLAEIAAQYVDEKASPKEQKQKIDEINKFIDDHYTLSQEAPPDDAKWKALLAAADSQYPPKNYEIGRGQVQALVGQIEQQHPKLPPLEIASVVREEENRTKSSARGQALTQEQVQERKDLIAQQGSLEFRIFANTANDDGAITAAEAFFNAPKAKDELERLAVLDQPPPPPTQADGSKYFETKLGRVSYSWVELGSYYRGEHGLANPRDSKGNLTRDFYDTAKQEERDKRKLWFELATARKEGKAIKTSLGMGYPASFLVFSRDVKTAKVTERDRDKEYEYYVLARDPDPTLRNKDLLSSASPGSDPSGGLAVNFRIRSEYGEDFRTFTQTNKGQIMAIVLDGMVETSAEIKDAISTSGIISGGGFTAKKVDDTVKILRSGALPATLKPQPVSENTMGPTLGADTIRAGALSVGIAFAIVLVFMLVYYEFAGLVACVALLANLFLTLAFMVLIDATFTLPGLAGLVLMLGMAVDANILIYERLREERDRGASLAMAIRNGYDRALPTIIDTHLSSIFTAVVLYVVGNDQLKGFGISLTVGLVISLFTSLYMTRLMFDVALAKGWITKLNMRRLLSKPNIDFMAIRYYWFTATVILTIAGAALFIHRDKNGLNIDFIGGTAYGGELVKPMDIDDIRKQFVQSDSKLPDLSVEQIFISAPGYTEGSRSKLFTVRTSEKNRVDVLAEINRVLGKGREERADLPPDQRKSLLVTVDLASYRVLPDEKTAASGRTLWLAQIPASQAGAPGGSPLGVLAQLFAASRVAEPETTARTVAFSFVEKKEDPETHEIIIVPAFTSRASVAMFFTQLMEKKAKELGEAGEKERQNTMESAAKQMSIDGLGKDNEGRFQWMELHLQEPLKGESLADFKSVLADAKDQFGHQPLPERLENFDSQLATDTQLRALYAILASWGAILLYLWFRFGNWTFGAAAVLCLIHDLFFTLGMIAFCHYIHDTAFGRMLRVEDFKIDLQTVAALLTLVGYSVSDTIVVFDRIREVRGKNPELTPQTINDSVNQTLSRTLLTAFSVWLVVIVLYAFGGEGVHLFAFVMVVGVIVGTYSSIYIASPLLLIFGEGRAPGTVPAIAPTPRETGAPA